MILKSYMKRLPMFISGLSLCVFLCVGTSSAAPFQNGSFEIGTTANPFVQVNAGDTNITDWAVIVGSVDYISTLWTAHSGARSID